MDETPKLEVSGIFCSWGKAAGIPADAAKVLGLCPLCSVGRAGSGGQERGRERMEEKAKEVKIKTK